MDLLCWTREENEAINLKKSVIDLPSYFVLVGSSFVHGRNG